MPALWVRFAGAIALGLIYQFYYGGGDTFNYFNQGKVIAEALINDPIIGFKLLMSNGEMNSEIFSYASRIYWFQAPSEFLIIKMVGLFSFFTGVNYSSTSLFFAVFSFSGSWAIYSVVQKKYPEISKYLALSTLFVPSCVFWGAGILKDTVTLGALGFLFWGFNEIIEKQKCGPRAIVAILVSSWLLFSIKIYILICFIPAVFIWWYLIKIRSIKNSILKVVSIPFLVLFFASSSYLLLEIVASTSDRYRLESLAEWSYITSYDIRYYTGKNAGSGYDLGKQDGTWPTLLKLAPAAINVSLFRPYFWEVKNPLMFLSASEALIFTVLSVRLLFMLGDFRVRSKLNSPMIVMMLLFTLVFAFAVGVSTYNFGTLSRYKIPLISFYLALIFVLITRPSKIMNN